MINQIHGYIDCRIPMPIECKWSATYLSLTSYDGSIHCSHCYHIFPWLCAWEVCYIIFCHLLHIRSGKTGNMFSLLLYSLWSVQIFGYVFCLQIVLVCLYSTPSHYHHCANLSEGIVPMKCLPYILCRVCE